MSEFVVHSRKGRTEDNMDSTVPTEKVARDLDYMSPERVLAPTRLYHGGAIPLDPATNSKNSTGALQHFALQPGELALTEAWFTAHKSAGLKKYLAAQPGPFELKKKDKKTGEITVTTHEWRIFARDGLRESWQHAAGVYVNPPYGRALRAWLEKIGAEASTDRGLPITALIPASRFEQGYFQTEVLAKANMLCSVRKRLAFTRPSTGEPAKGNPYASLLFGYNVDEERFKECYHELGYCVRLSD